MLRKTSVSMMVLLVVVVVVASLIGIASIYQYEEGQVPKLQQVQKAESAAPIVRGQTQFATLIPSKTCIAVVQLPGPDEPNLLGLKPGTQISVYAPPETCTLFGLSKIGNTQIQFDGEKMNPSSKTLGYRATQVTL